MHYFQKLPLNQLTIKIMIYYIFSAKQKQKALEIAYQNYSRRYITFNFKGKGNAQLLLFNYNRAEQFKVYIFT